MELGSGWTMAIASWKSKKVVAIRPSLCEGTAGEWEKLGSTDESPNGESLWG